MDISCEKNIISFVLLCNLIQNENGRPINFHFTGFNKTQIPLVFVFIFGS